MRSSQARLLAACLVAALAGCAPQGFDKPLTARMQRNLAAGVRSQKHIAVSAAVANALIPPVTIQLPHARTLAVPSRFDFNTHDAPAAQVFTELVRGTSYSIALPGRLPGRITLHLKNVTVPEAMRVIRTEDGYQYRRRGHQFYILPPGLRTRLFRVHYLDIIRTGVSETRLTGESLTSVGTTGGTMGGAPMPATGQQTMSPTISVKTTSRSDFWKTLAQTVTALVGEKPGREVVANPEAGLLVVRAGPRTLHTVSRFLRLTQASVDREVVIDAKILEVDLKSGYQSGIDWAKLGNLAGAQVIGAQTGGSQLLSSGVATIGGNTGNINPAYGTPNPYGPSGYSAINNTAVSAFGGIFSLALHAGNFAAFIQLLNTEGRVQVLSSPRVSTVNEQKAVIKVGGDQFFVTGVTNTESLVGISPIATPAVELSPFFSGIALDVTPEIDGHGSIILYIHPSVSQVTQVNQQFSVSGQAFNLPLASSSIQESDSVVRAQSGQVIVIGGLMKEGSTNSNASVPLLGNIPLLGNLFKDKKVVRVKKELVILLKPTVVNLGGPWGRELSRAQRRIARITGQ
ncbi:pilus (MSHA type) biogenesis protein MshL [Acidiferrobacter sp.]|uniref:pilus (MSHA type) biogenesis protein MshL n=1 Tax=Acidiferrobacter sp. TaxID=1872107 RepID=UPI00262D0B16|nr:pilus (MSHA type) biogenesis protein MshL [Acidiferrobacter sp.]